jgi:tetratricopeptide (TPR) repeat protein
MASWGVACLLALGPPAGAQAPWDKAKQELKDFQQNTLPRWGITVKVEDNADLSNVPAHLKITGGYESDDSVNVGVETGLSAEGAGTVNLTGRFTRTADGANYEGAGVISIRGGPEARYKYTSEHGLQLEMGAEEGFLNAGVQIGDPKKGPVELGVKVGPVTVAVDPAKYARHLTEFLPAAVREVERRVHGVLIYVDLQLLAMAVTDRPPQDVAKLGEVSLVSLKRLQQALARGEASDLGDVTSVIGMMVDDKRGDVILIGRHEPWAPRIPADVLLAVLKSVWRDGLSPWVSLDPSQELEDNLPSAGGVSKGLEDSALVRILLEADYRMKRVWLGLDPVVAPGFKPIAERLAELKGRERELAVRRRIWLTPRQPEPGDIWRVEADNGALLVFESGVRINCAYINAAAASGQPERVHPLDKAFAVDCTRYYGDLERQYPELKQLHQIFELQLAASILRLRGLQGGPAQVLTALCARPVASDPHPGKFPLCHIRLNDSSVRLCGGVLSRLAMRQAVQQVVSQLSGLMSRLDGLAWDGPTAHAGGFFRPLVDDTQNFQARLRAAELLTEAWGLDDPDRVSQKVSQAIELDPQLAYAYVLRAAASVTLNKPEAAARDIERAIRLQPDEANVMRAAAVIYSELNMPIEAMDAVTKATELDPSDWRSPYNRAVLHLQRGMAKEAIEDLNLAIRRGGAVGFVLERRAAAYLVLGDYEATLKDCDRAIKDDPDRSETHYSRGVALYVLGHDDEAIAAYSRAFELDPDNLKALSERGVAHLHVGQLGQAAGDFAELVRRDPKNEFAWNMRGRCRQRLGDRAGAVADYGKVLELNPENLDARYNRGLLYQALGKKKEALSDFRTWLQGAPNDDADRADVANRVKQLEQ